MSTASRGMWTSSASAHPAGMLREGSTSQRIRKRHNHTQTLLACSALLHANRTHSTKMLWEVKRYTSYCPTDPSGLQCYNSRMRILLNAYIPQKLDSRLHWLDLSMEAGKQKA